MPLNILIIGAGVCGPALSLMLQRSNPAHRITILERWPVLRQGGQQIDLRAQGLPVMRKLGLLDAVKERSCAEDGIALVDSSGRQRAMFGKNDSGQGAQSFTSEYEIMRGDLVNIFYQASLEEAEDAEGKDQQRIKYEFGRTVTELSQDADGVDVTFSDGATGRYDLVVGADGQGSRTRRMLFGAEAGAAAFKSLDLLMAYFTVPRVAEDNRVAKWYTGTRSRNVATRTGEALTTQVVLMTMNAEGLPALRRSLKEGAEKQKEEFARVFEDAGWQTKRLLRGMEDTPDFYAQDVGQVKIEHAVKGRVALLGDAGYCPSPMTGMGTTLSLTGAYVLAGELARHGDDNVAAALEAYETVLRPFITEAQKLPPGLPGIAYPSTWYGVAIFNTIVGLISWLKIDKLMVRLLPEDKGGLAIPQYPELNMSRRT